MCVRLCSSFRCLVDCKAAHQAHRSAENMLRLQSVFFSEVVLNVSAHLKGSCAATGLAGRRILFLIFLMMGC